MNQARPAQMCFQLFYRFNFLQDTIMTTHFAKSAVSALVLAAAALGAASSFAGASDAKTSDGQLLFPAFTSSLTRAQVQAEYFKAVKSGQIVQATEGTVLKAPAFVSTRLAAEVRAEGVYAAHHANMGGSI